MTASKAVAVPLAARGMAFPAAGYGRPVVRFDAQALVPVDLETAFDLSLSIDVHLGSFEQSGEQAVDGVTAGLIGLGEFVTWRARHFGITWTMTSAITEWDRPHRFVDEQRKGPFKSFRHEHVFEPVAPSTRLVDHVEFEAPLGMLGRAAERLVLARYLRHLIDVRNTFLVTEATRLGVTKGSDGDV
jgi:ligand-binding SRPBCC domain-containing protein